MRPMVIVFIVHGTHARIAGHPAAAETGWVIVEG